MSAPREVVQSPVPWSTLPDAAAWLLGYVRTDVPGHREMVFVGNYFCVVAPGEYRFDALITAVNAAADAVASYDPLVWRSTGSVTGDGISRSFPDRLGWVLGRGSALVDDTTPMFVPPAGIPLIGVTWTHIESDADRRVIVDRHRRNQGYVWGAALIWHCKLVMHRWALEALQTGWCLRGKVTLGAADMLDTPVSSSEPAGAITGYALGLGGVRWLDSIQHHAEVELFIVSE